MAYSLVGNILTLEAAADLSDSQYCAVNVDTNGKFALPSAGGRIVGVLTSKAELGEAAPAQIAGVAKMKLGGTVAKGDWVKVDASGQAVAAVATDEAVGICLEGGAISEIGSVLLTGPGYTTLV